MINWAIYQLNLCNLAEAIIYIVIYKNDNACLCIKCCVCHSADSAYRPRLLVALAYRPDDVISDAAERTRQVARQAIMGERARLDQPLTRTHRRVQAVCVGVSGVSWTIADVLMLVGGMLVTVLCNVYLAHWQSTLLDVFLKSILKFQSFVIM